MPYQWDSIILIKGVYRFISYDGETLWYVTVINTNLYSRLKMSTESLAQQVVAMVTTMTRMWNILTYLYGNKTILGKYQEMCQTWLFIL